MGYFRSYLRFSSSLYHRFVRFEIFLSERKITAAADVLVLCAVRLYIPSQFAIFKLCCLRVSLLALYLFILYSRL